MAGLLADGWFYISSAGLLVSGVLFFFLLSQYRAAGDAADQQEPEAAAEIHAAPVRRVFIPDELTPSPRIASVPADKPAEKTTALEQPAAQAPSEPKRDAPPAPVEKRRESSTGGVNPAVVYLQNIKNQLEELHGETRELTKRMDAITGRDEALIERLLELTQAVAELKGSQAAAPAPVEPSAPKRAKKNETPPAVVKTEVPAVAPAPAPESVTEPVVGPAVASAAPPALAIEPTTVSGVPEAKKEVSPDETMRLDPKPKPAAEAPPAESLEESEPERPRRGPVWPV
jgi:hypothetical protein